MIVCSFVCMCVCMCVCVCVHDRLFVCVHVLHMRLCIMSFYSHKALHTPYRIHTGTKINLSWSQLILSIILPTNTFGRGCNHNNIQIPQYQIVQRPHIRNNGFYTYIIHIRTHVYIVIHSTITYNQPLHSWPVQLCHSTNCDQCLSALL